jgi:hypothetical protein
MLRTFVRSLSLVAILAGTAAAADPPATGQANKTQTAKVSKKKHKAKAKKAARKSGKHHKAKAKKAKKTDRPMP